MTEFETALPARFGVDRTEAAADSRPRSAVAGRRLGLTAVCLLALVLGGAEIRNEGYVSLQGDMPRHMMNGVFLADLLHDRPFTSLDTLIDYTHLYYARYPALSLGHHPPLLAAAQVPLFAIFGPSVWAARTVVLLSMVGAAALLFLLVANRYGALAGWLSATLFVTSPLIVELGQSVLSEVLAIALLLAAAYCLDRFWATEKRWALAGFVVAATCSLYAKQLAILAFPAFLFLSLASVGWRPLLRRDVLIATGILLLLILPLGLVTISMSPTNVRFVAEAWAAPRDGLGAMVRGALGPQLSPPVAILAVVGLLLAAVRRDWRAAMFVGWIGGVFLGLYSSGLSGGARYSVYWVPAICAMAGSVVAGWRHPWGSRLAAAVLVAAVVIQATAARAVALPQASGYEDAARFVLASDPGPTVLFSGGIDTGFFTFFVRKHDPDRRLVVLRADKVLTTSFLARPELTSRIADAAEIYPILRRFGTRYIVIEDRLTKAPTLEVLRNELRTDSFVERTRIEIVSSDWRLKGTSLVVYEFLDATAPDPDAALSMAMPVVGRSLEVKLSDLIDRKYLR